MIAKEYLEQYQVMQNKIESELYEIQKLDALRLSISVATDREYVQSSGSKDKLGDVTAKLVDLQVELSEDVDAMLDLRKNIKAQIETVADTEAQRLLNMRYICGYTFEKISAICNCSDRQVYRNHQRALGLFDDIYHELYASM